MKPPAREIALDALEDLWRNCKSSDTGPSLPFYADFCLTDDDAKAPTAKHLAKWRPYVLASENKPRSDQALNDVQIPDDSKHTPQSGPSPAEKAEGEQMKNNQASQPVAAAG